MAEIEIDGKKLTVEAGTMVIQAADDAGIPIPRFCYHKKLSIVANCRMCLVEVEKSPKPLPACATPVTDGMKVYTKSATAIAAQGSVMEFLLINLNSNIRALVFPSVMYEIYRMVWEVISE